MTTPSCSTDLWRSAYLRLAIYKVLQYFPPLPRIISHGLTGGYWEPGQDVYGTRIHNRSSGEIFFFSVPTIFIEFHLVGTVHDHIVNFKVSDDWNNLTTADECFSQVDFDIAGIENSLLRTSVSVDDTKLPWLDEDWGPTIRQQSIVRSYITNETQSRLFYPKNSEGGYSIVNKKSLNAWGYPQGYTIVPGNSPIHSVSAVVSQLFLKHSLLIRLWLGPDARSRTLISRSIISQSAKYALYYIDIHLLSLTSPKRKDTEPSSSSAWNLNLPGAPPVDFDLFFDG